MKLTLQNSVLLFACSCIVACSGEPKTPTEASNYLYSHCPVGYEDSKDCVQAHKILYTYKVNLSKDIVINKLLKIVTDKEISCESAEPQTIPECIALKLRLNEIDKFGVATPLGMIVTYEDFLGNEIEDKNAKKRKLLIQNNTIIAESILQGIK